MLRGTIALDADLVAEAFAMMTSPGRLEIVRRSPVVLVDAAHNPAGMAATAGALAESFVPAEVIAGAVITAGDARLLLTGDGTRGRSGPISGPTSGSG